MAFKKAAPAILEEQKVSKDFGMKLLTEFHKGNQKFNNYKISLAQLVAMLEKRPNQKNFVSILGGSVLNSGVLQSKALASMQVLAANSKGRIPSSNAYFRQAIVDGATAFSYVDAAVFTVSETASQVVNGVASVGSTLIDTGKILQFLFPIAVVYFLYIFLKKKVA